MSEASRTNEAERVEFSRLSIIRLKTYSARKEGKTEAQENDFAAKPSSAAMRNGAFLPVKSFSNAGVFPMP